VTGPSSLHDRTRQDLLLRAAILEGVMLVEKERRSSTKLDFLLWVAERA
jgi:hypothetical protein